MLSTSRHGKNGRFASLTGVVIATMLVACGAENAPKPIPNSSTNAPPANTDKVFRLVANSRVTHEATAKRTRLTLAEPLALDGAAPVTITSDAPRDFPLGETVVTWSAQDQSGKTAQLAQTIVVSDTKPPLVDAPPAVTMTVDRVGTFSVALGEPKTFDALDNVSVTNDAPASFAMGETRVTWTVTDQAGNVATAVQSVTITLAPSVVDITPPTLTPPADITAVSSDGLPVTVTLGTPTASDDSGVPIVTNNAPTQFPVGLTLVSWTAEDAAGNRTVATQRVSVTSATATDTTPPTLTLSKPTTIGPIEASAARTTIDIGTASALDAADGAVTARNDAPANGFPVGATTVTWFATDRAGNTATVLQTVTVVDTTAPTITVPANIEQTGERSLNAVTLGAATATDLVDGSVTVTNNAPTAGFPIDTTVVTWTATDRAGNTARAEQRVNLVAAACSASVPFFSDVVWPQVLETNCLTCHTGSGVTGAFNLLDSSVSDYLGKNFDTTKRVVIRKDAAGRPLLLSKASNAANDHGGGERFPITDLRYSVLEELSDRMTVCADDRAPSQQGLVLTSPYQHLRRATLALAGRLPTAGEETTVAAATTPEALTAAMNGILDAAMAEPAFFERVKEIYNDLLLTNAMANESVFMNMKVDLGNFANENYYAFARLRTQGYTTADIERLRAFAGQGIGYAPLELIAYVVKNNRPFTEILTADYVMVNPYTATLFSAAPIGAANFGFVYGDSVQLKDPADFRPATIVDNAGRRYPHAGVVNTLAFLGRYPSSPTNRNRARARYVFKYFLDTDIEGLADRSGLDLDNTIGTFPTLEDRQCKTCHDVMDPIAGLFKNWSNEGAFVGDRTDWYSERTPPEMLKPGYTVSDLLPSTDSARASKWLASRLIGDNRFAVSTVKTMAGALLGPVAVEQDALIEALKTEFVGSGFNLKSLIKQIINSKYFRAVNIGSAEPPAAYTMFGLNRLLTPEQLDRKITAVLGDYRWRSPGARSLREASTYLLLYGGIDSDEVTERTRTPTGVMAAIQDRLAFQISCEVTAADFARPDGSRVLFPGVAINDTPDVAAAKLRGAMQFLHKRVLGEELATDDAEITRTFELFVAARAAAVGKNMPAACAAGLPSTDPIRADALGTVQAWQAVMAYLLSDFRFYFE